MPLMPVPVQYGVQCTVTETPETPRHFGDSA